MGCHSPRLICVLPLCSSLGMILFLKEISQVHGNHRSITLDTFHPGGDRNRYWSVPSECQHWEFTRLTYQHVAPHDIAETKGFIFQQTRCDKGHWNTRFIVLTMNPINQSCWPNRLRGKSLKAHLKLLCRDNINTYKFGTFSFRMLYYCSVVKLCLTVCEPMDGSTPSSPVLHYSRCLLKLMWYMLNQRSFCYCHPTAVIHGLLIWGVEVRSALSPSLSLIPPWSLSFY